MLKMHGKKQIPEKTQEQLDALNEVQKQYAKNCKFGKHIKSYATLIKDTIDKQIKNQETILQTKENLYRTLKTLFAHTKRDAMKFCSESIIARMIVCFCALEDINAKIVLPKDLNNISHENLYDALLANVINIDLLPHGLIKEWGNWVKNQNTIKLPERFGTFLKDQNARKRYIAENADECIPLIKNFLSTAIPLDYFTHERNDTIITTPRILKIGEGYLLIQENTIVYDEKHLQHYKGTNYFARFFSTKEELIAYEYETIESLKKQKERFADRQTELTKGLEHFIARRSEAIVNNNNQNFKTETDGIIEQTLKSKQAKMLTNREYIEKTLNKYIEERLTSIDNMIATIQAQITTSI